MGHQERHQPRRYRGHLQEGPRRHPRQPRPGGKEGQKGDQETVDRQEAHLRGQEAEGQGPEGGIPRSNGGPVKTQNRYTTYPTSYRAYAIGFYYLISAMEINIFLRASNESASVM